MNLYLILSRQSYLEDMSEEPDSEYYHNKNKQNVVPNIRNEKRKNNEYLFMINEFIWGTRTRLLETLTNK